MPREDDDETETRVIRVTVPTPLPRSKTVHFTLEDGEAREAPIPDDAEPGGELEITVNFSRSKMNRLKRFNRKPTLLTQCAACAKTLADPA
jgi:hypothetical protein